MWDRSRRSPSMDPALSKDRYRLLTKHFQRCVELPPSAWPDYVARLVIEDPDLGADLQGLLKHHKPETEAPATPPAAAVDTPTPHRTRRPRRRAAIRILLIAGLAIALIVLLGQVWALDRLESSLKRQAADGLHAALEVRIAGLRRWAKEKKRQARRIFGDHALVEPLARLAEAARAPEGLKKKLLSSPDFRTLSERAHRGLDESGDLGFTLLSPAGLALCADDEDRVGRVVGPEGARYVRRILLDESILSRPQPESELF